MKRFVIVLLLIVNHFSVDGANESSTQLNVNTAWYSLEGDTKPQEFKKNSSKAEYSESYTTLTYDKTQSYTIESSTISNNDILSKLPTSPTGERSNGKIQNVQIHPVYNSTFNKIVLNVSWDKPLDIADIYSYDFKITPNFSEGDCKGKVHNKKNLNKTLTSILLPEPFIDYDIKPSCTYIVSITTNRSERKVSTDTNYTLAECVFNKCSCKRLTPKVKNLQVVAISPGMLNISWDFHREGANITQIINITDVTLEYRASTSQQFHPYVNLAKLSKFGDIEDYLIVNKSFDSGKEYAIQGIFNNVYRCYNTSSTNFILNSTKALYQWENDATKPKNGSWEVILIVIIASLVVLFVLYISRRNRLVLKELILNPSSLCLARQRRHMQEPGNVRMPPNNKRQPNILYVETEILDGTADHYEIPRAKIEMIHEIGEGAFGQVYLAKALDVQDQPGYTFVAVKTLRERAPPEEMNDFLSEIKILKKVGDHPNIVRLYGCCILKEPYLMVMEFVPCGDLKHYLLDLRQQWLRKKQTKRDSPSVFSDSSDCAYITPDNSKSGATFQGRPSATETEYTIIGNESAESCYSKVECNLDHTELQNFALQIAKGMEYLEKIPLAHRDLAARNILINQCKTLKISDFGLSRIGPYVNKKTKRLPLRWLAIEAIENNFCDSKSDVWSFAVVLWEIGTLGAFPYENIMDRMLRHHLTSGKRLLRPEICTNELYSLMLRCWSHDPQLRPSFQELVELLDVKRRRIYVDFNQLNPLYVFPPSKLPEYDQKLIAPDIEPSS